MKLDTDSQSFSGSLESLSINTKAKAHFHRLTALQHTLLYITPAHPACALGYKSPTCVAMKVQALEEGQ